jgi:hypothetical protein
LFDSFGLFSSFGSIDLFSSFGSIDSFGWFGSFCLFGLFGSFGPFGSFGSFGSLISTHFSIVPLQDFAPHKHTVPFRFKSFFGNVQP